MRRLPLLLCSIGVFAFAGYVSSATITVTTTEPGINADGLCSFAEAVENVNGGDVHSDCAAGGDGLNIIELGQGETYLQRDGDGYDFLGGLTLINGNGSTFDAMNEEDQWGPLLIFEDAIISDLTIKGGNLYYGAIWAWGRLYLNRCTFLNNRTGVRSERDAVLQITDSAFLSNGIAIDSDLGSTVIAQNTDFFSNSKAIYGPFYSAYDHLGVVTLLECAVNGNQDGIWVVTLEIRNSTVTNNGTGVIANSGVVENCTLSDNSVGVRLSAITIGGERPRFEIRSSTVTRSTGWGVYVGGGGGGIAHIRDSTIHENETGLYGLADRFEVKNSIIGSNVINCDGDSWYKNSSSRGFNLTDDDSCNLNHSTDMVVSDVMLSELGDWGGSTLTHMPLEGSPAIDMVKWAGQCSRLDQRGYLRNADGDGDGVAHCDCGAVEYGSAPPPRPYDPRAYPSEIE